MEKYYDNEQFSYSCVEYQYWFLNYEEFPLKYK